MPPVVWTEDAEEDLAKIIEYVFERDPVVARRLWERLKASTLSLSDHPYPFKESDRIPGYREIVAHPNYLVFYRVLADRVQIEMVAHARRMFPLRT
jgi:toxin ParE1/3/4